MDQRLVHSDTKTAGVKDCAAGLHEGVGEALHETAAGSGGKDDTAIEIEVTDAGSARDRSCCQRSTAENIGSSPAGDARKKDIADVHRPASFVHRAGACIVIDGDSQRVDDAGA